MSYSDQIRTLFNTSTFVKNWVNYQIGYWNLVFDLSIDLVDPMKSNYSEDYLESTADKELG